ncbi:MAG: hypothetical protein HFH90_08800 [Lachnospiraceae bacterium]|nr:hypothetical protein [Lachnospiraceae bacterium]
MKVSEFLDCIAYYLASGLLSKESDVYVQGSDDVLLDVKSIYIDGTGDLIVLS